jgi:hypothetical protein
MWPRVHPAPRWLLAALLVLAGLGLAAASLSRSTSPAALPAAPPATVSDQPPPATASAPLATVTPTPAASPALESSAEATAVARNFLTAYLSQRPDDAPAALRQRLRPFDTDAFDVGLAQGGGAGQPVQAAAARVQRLDATGLAPDGRLVLVALLGEGGSTRYLELFMARTAAGWRVDEVTG